MKYVCFIVYLEGIITFLIGMPPPLEKTEEGKELTAFEKALLALQSKQATELESHLQKLKDAKTKVLGEEFLHLPSVRLPNQMSGQIGERDNTIN